MDGTELIVTTTAVLLSPLLAVEVQKRIEGIRERSKRRQAVFCALMATRGNRVSPEHVEALNRIDLEFYDTSRIPIGRQRSLDLAVLSAWRLYLDHLNTPFNEASAAAWEAKGDDLFTELLSAMAKSLRFNFDRIHIKRSLYVPVAHSRQQLEDQAVRESIIKLMSGETALPISIVMPAQNPAPQQSFTPSYPAANLPHPEHQRVTGM